MTEPQIASIMTLFEVDRDVAIQLIDKGVNAGIADSGVNMLESEMNGIVNRYTNAFNQAAKSVQVLSQDFDSLAQAQTR